VREAAARDTRRRIVQAAADCFTRDGYSATTLRKIATEAGVSVETVNGHGPKGALLFAAFESAFLGREGMDSMSTEPEFVAAQQRADVGTFLPAVVQAVTDSFERADGIWRALTAAVDVDQGVAAAHQELVQRRRADFTSMVLQLQQRGLGAAVNIEPAVDVLTLVCSPESYHHLVKLCGWSRADFQAWVVGAVQRQLADPIGPVAG
jgi:AcrR family transcriptional regulator